MFGKYVLTIFLFLLSVFMGDGLRAQSDPARIRLWENGSVIFSATIGRIDSMTFVSADAPDSQDEGAFRLDRHTVKMPVTMYDIQTASDIPATERITVMPADGSYRIDASKEGVVTWQIMDGEIILSAVAVGRTTLTVSDMDKDVSAECEVEVVPVLESMTFTQAFLSANLSDTYLARLDTVDSVFLWTNAAGKQVALRAFLIDVTLDLFSDGFYVDEHYAYAGSPSGYIASFPGRMWYAPEGMNSDRGFNSQASVITGVWNTQGKALSKALTAGTFANVDEAFGHVRLAIESFNRYMESQSVEDLKSFQKEMQIADTMAFKGARLIRAKYMESRGEYGWDFMPVALITSGFIRLAEWNKYETMYSVPEAQMQLIPIVGDNGWGVRIERDTETGQFKVLDEGFKFGEPVYYHHSPVSEGSAPTRETVRTDRRELSPVPAYFSHPSNTSEP